MIIKAGDVIMKKLVLIGAGGHCKVIIDIIGSSYEIVGITDNDVVKHGKNFYGQNVIGNDDILRYIYQQDTKLALITVGSIGESKLRERLFDYAKDIGFDFPNILSKNVIVSPSIIMGIGNVLMDSAIIHADTAIGDNNIINTGAIIEHDCVIGSHVHVAPGARISGGVNIGDGSHIGIGATVIQGIRIGKNSVIGAGAVVIRDVEDNTTVVGVPAKPTLLK